ncbi:nucleotidyltransferase family protein [Aeromonas caviae]
MQLADYQFLQALARLPFVEAIWLFGSRARGEQRERSDIDLAIECPGACEAQWQQVLAIIDEADTLLPIDCVRLDEESPQSLLYQAILCDRVPLYRRMTP